MWADVKFVTMCGRASTLCRHNKAITHYGIRLQVEFGFCRSLPPTPRGAKYVLVMIEHFSKWIELVALPQNSSKLATTHS